MEVERCRPSDASCSSQFCQALSDYNHTLSRRPLARVALRQFRGSIPDTHLLYREKNRVIFEPIFREAIQQGIFRNIDAFEALTAGANMLFGLVVTSCAEGRSKDIRRRAEFAVDLFCVPCSRNLGTDTSLVPNRPSTEA